jgi:hypothetical protein
MHRYNFRAPFERIAIDAPAFPQSDQGNLYLLTTMDYFTKWLEAYTIPNQEASKVAEALVTNFFCHFRVPGELHSYQHHNFESRLIQEVLRWLQVSNTHTTPLHLQLDGMVEHYIKTVKEHLQKVVTSQRDWDARLPIFLAYTASTRDTAGLTPSSLMFRRLVQLPYDLFFGAPPTRKDPQLITWQI